MGGGSVGKGPNVKLPGKLRTSWAFLQSFPVLAELHVAIQHNVNMRHPRKLLFPVMLDTVDLAPWIDHQAHLESTSHVGHVLFHLLACHLREHSASAQCQNQQL